jgi:hypothetical protein
MDDEIGGENGFPCRVAPFFQTMAGLQRWIFKTGRNSDQNR